MRSGSWVRSRPSCGIRRVPSAAHGSPPTSRTIASTHKGPMTSSFRRARPGRSQVCTLQGRTARPTRRPSSSRASTSSSTRTEEAEPGALITSYLSVPPTTAPDDLTIPLSPALILQSGDLLDLRPSRSRLARTRQRLALGVPPGLNRRDQCVAESGRRVRGWLRRLDAAPDPGPLRTSSSTSEGYPRQPRWDRRLRTTRSHGGWSTARSIVDSSWHRRGRLLRIGERVDLRLTSARETHALRHQGVKGILSSGQRRWRV